MTTKVEKTITVNVPISTAYNQWTQFEEFPHFMEGIESVRQLDEKRLHWVAEIGGVKREWYATILEQRPDEKIAWAATEGATNAGAVYFSAAGMNQTSVTLELEYEPEGLVEKAADALNIVGRQAQSDLEKFKSFIESSDYETGAWRGNVEGQTVGTPGVESATSHGDSGKAGISGKAAAAGVAVAAAGVAAAAAARSGSSDTTETETDTTYVETAQPVIVEDTSYQTTPDVVAAPITDVGQVSDSTLVADDSYGVGAGDEVLVDDDQLDSSTPGVTTENDGRSQGTGTL